MDAPDRLSPAAAFLLSEVESLRADVGLSTGLSDLRRIASRRFLNVAKLSLPGEIDRNADILILEAPFRQLVKRSLIDSVATRSYRRYAIALLVADWAALSGEEQDKDRAFLLDHYELKAFRIETVASSDELSDALGCDSEFARDSYLRALLGELVRDVLNTVAERIEASDDAHARMALAAALHDAELRLENELRALLREGLALGRIAPNHNKLMAGLNALEEDFAAKVRRAHEDFASKGELGAPVSTAAEAASPSFKPRMSPYGSGFTLVIDAMISVLYDSPVPAMRRAISTLINWNDKVMDPHSYANFEADLRAICVGKAAALRKAMRLAKRRLDEPSVEMRTATALVGRARAILNALQ